MIGSKANVSSYMLCLSAHKGANLKFLIPNFKAMSQFRNLTLCLLGMASLLLLSGCSLAYQMGMGSDKLVVLDIGHFEGGPGARTPSKINGKSITEHEFWYQYAYYTKRAIERGGYECVVTNRGKKPMRPHMLAYAKKTHVVHIGKPDETSRGSYASKYSPDRVGMGVVSADYALYRGASCVVFLHHNSNSNRWRKGGSPSLMLVNRYNGQELGDTMGRYLEEEILDERGGMYNGGIGVRTVKRYGDGQSAASWLNVLDDYGVPAAVLEVAFLNNRNHAEYLSDHDKAIDYAEAVGEGIVEYMDVYRDAPRHYRADKNKGDEGSFGRSRYNRKRTVAGAVKL